MRASAPLQVALRELGREELLGEYEAVSPETHDVDDPLVLSVLADQLGCPEGAIYWAARALARVRSRRYPPGLGREAAFNRIREGEEERLRRLLEGNAA